MGIDQDNTKYDEDIKFAINKASRYVDNLTGRLFYKLTLSGEYLNTTNGYNGWKIINRYSGGLIYTPKFLPIISISSLSESGLGLTENTDFYIDYAAGMIEKADGNWVKEPREILISGSIGYDSDDTATPSDNIPGEINMSTIELAARLSGRFKKQKINYASGGAESIDLYEIPSWLIKNLKAWQPVEIL